MTATSDAPGADNSIERGTTANALTQSDAADVFPLPLVPFERYMLADDRPAYPMTFFIRVELEGTLDKQAMDAAFVDALRRHPLLTARLARRGAGLCWVPADGAPPRLRWECSATQPALPVGQPIDLKHDVGIDGFVHTSGRKLSVIVSFHHAACDGIGGFRFVGDLLAYYGRRTASKENIPTLLPINAANLPFRGMFDIQTAEAVSAWDVFKSTIREGWKVMSRRPLPLMNRNRPRGEARKKRATMPVAVLETEMYRRFCERAAELGVTANDLLLRDMFLTAHNWNESRGGHGTRGWLRINMPTTLRGKRDSRMPAANVLGYALVTRHTDECGDPSRLLMDIAADTEAIRTWSLGALFVEAIRHADRVPGLLAVGARISRRFSTLVLSNLGDPSRRFRARFPRSDGEIQAGNLTVKSMVGIPPIRPGTRSALALFNYAGKLAIALHPDPRWFSAEDAREFLSLYRRRLEESAGGSR